MNEEIRNASARTNSELVGSRYSRRDLVKSFKGCLPQILLYPFLNTLSQLFLSGTENNILLERLRTQSEHFGLNLNISKTKVMFIGNHAEEASCNINGVILENVYSFQYLGRVITNSNNGTKAAEKLKDRKTPMSTKKKTFETYFTMHYVWWCRNKNVEKRST